MGVADDLSDLSEVGKAAVRTKKALESQGEEDDSISAIVEYALLGDIYEIVHEERKPPLIGIGIRMVITFIPYVDQAADVEDMGAWIYIACTRGVEDPMVKLQGVLCFIGVIPTIGSAARGVLKVVANNPKSLKPIISTLNSIGDGGHGVRWLREFAADMPKHADDAAKLAKKTVDGLIEQLESLRGYRLMPKSAVRKIDGWVESLRKVSDGVPSMFSETAAMLKGKLDDLLAEFDAKHFDLDSVAKDDAFRKQTQALPSDGHGVIDDVASDGRGVVDDVASKGSAKAGGSAQAGGDLAQDGGVVDMTGRGTTPAKQDAAFRTPSQKQLVAGGLADGLPPGSRVVKETDDYVVYQTADGAERIRFRASEANAYNEYVAPGRNYSTECEACLTPDGKVMVLEGKHRAVGAAHGDVVPEELGGVSGQSGVLDYEYYNHTSSYAGVPVRDLQVDYTQPELSRDAADVAREEMLRRH